MNLSLGYLIVYWGWKLWQGMLALHWHTDYLHNRKHIRVIQHQGSILPTANNDCSGWLALSQLHTQDHRDCSLLWITSYLWSFSDVNEKMIDTGRICGFFKLWNFTCATSMWPFCDFICNRNLITRIMIRTTLAQIKRIHSTMLKATDNICWTDGGFWKQLTKLIYFVLVLQRFDWM